MKLALIFLSVSPLLIGCATKEKKVIVHKNIQGEYVLPKKKKKGIFYGPSKVPGAMDPRNSTSPDTLRARENGTN